MKVAYILGGIFYLDGVQIIDSIKYFKWNTSVTLSGETLSVETFRRAKFSSLNEKFVTFARRKVSPNKSKSVL